MLHFKLCHSFHFENLRSRVCSSQNNRYFSSKTLAILGGGISGLSTAYFLSSVLKDPATQIVLLEKTNRFGGWVETLQIKDFLFERGPRSIRSGGKGYVTLELINRLGLNSELVFGNPQFVGKRFLFINGKLEALPTSLWGVVSSSIMRPIIWSLMREPFRKQNSPKDPNSLRVGNDDETIAEFFSRRFNSYLVETFVAPMVLGIFSGDVHKLSIKSCFPELYEGERKYGSIIKGMVRMNQPNQRRSGRNQIISFRGGLETLVKRLVDTMNKFPNVSLKHSTSVQKIEFTSDHRFKLYLDNSIIEADYVFSTLPGPNLGKLIPQSASSTLLQSIPFSRIAVVNIGFDSEMILPQHRGFGYLIPPKEKQAIMGVIFDSCTFLEQNNGRIQTRFTVMIGGDTENASLVDKPNEELCQLALQTLQKHLNINAKPSVVQVSKCEQAIPQYYVGHSQKIQAIQHSCEREFDDKLVLLGNTFHGVGVNDCIFSSKAAVDKFLTHYI